MAMNSHNVSVSSIQPAKASIQPKRVQEVVILKGVPCSGKTTFALELQRSNPGKYKRVNKAELRQMIDMGKFSKKKEKYINDVRDAVIGIAVADGFSVIVDDINLNPVHEARIRKLISGYNEMLDEDVAISVIDFNDTTSLEEVMQRNERSGGPERSLSDLQKKGKIIVKLWKKYVKPRVTRDLPVVSGDVDKNTRIYSPRLRTFDFGGDFPFFETENALIIAKSSEIKERPGSCSNA